MGLIIEPQRPPLVRNAIGFGLSAGGRAAKKKSSGAAAAFDPANLSLTGWWRASYGGSPWSPTASAGSSGSNGNLAEATNPPAVGTAQNGLTPADFDGTNDVLTNATAFSTLFTASAGSIIVLFLADVAVAAGLVYDDPGLFVDGSNGFLSANYSDSGFRAYVDDGATKSVSVAASTGAYHVGQMKWNGTNLSARVDSGSWSSTACGNASNLAGTVKVGPNYAGVQFFNGRILELMCAASALADATFTDIVGYINSRYALSL